MKRLLISIVLGTLLPLIYTIIVAPLSAYLPNRIAKLYVGYPVRWPVLLLYAIAPTRFGIPQVSELAMLLAIIVGNILVYSAIVYFVLFALSRRRGLTGPPPKTPPQPSK